MPDLAVILPAAGSSTRFGRNKLLEDLCGEPVFLRSLKGMANHQAVSAIVVATADAEVIRMLAQLSSAAFMTTVCPGGPTRAESVLNALRAVPARYEWVAVHDAARPLVSPELIDRTFQAALEYGAAVPAMPVSLTIKQAKGPLPAQVQRTIPRNELWTIQTPQIARRADLLQALERCPIPLEEVTDDVQALELTEKSVWLVQGDENNIKITTPLDFKLAETILADRMKS